MAQRAGVSLTTASKAINGRSRISAVTRAKVERAAEDLGYSPNQHARSLISGRSSTVGLIMFDSMTARFAVPVMLGAEDALTQIDLSLITADARGDRARFHELAAMFARRRVDGVLVVGDNNNLTPSITHLVSMPVVYVYGRSDSLDDVVHLVDDEQGGFVLARHLAGTGRTRIAHITGPRGTTAVDQRLAGIRAALRADGLKIAGGVRYGPWSQRWGRTAATKLLADRPDIDAVLCGSDQIAAGVVDAVVSSGRQIPDDVAVTGYDNWEPFALETEPPLTSMELNLAAVGHAAARDLFALMDDSTSGARVRKHPPLLVPRRSSVRASDR